MPLHPNMEPAEYMDILRRRKWPIVFSFLIIFFIALVYCVVVPDQYKSSVKVLVIPPTVSEGMVQTTVNISTRERLRSIEQDVLARHRLLEVINGIGVPKLGFQKMNEGKMLLEMRDRIEVQLSRRKDGDEELGSNSFLLSFYHENPKVAQEVASSLSSLFIGENIKMREAVTKETTIFLEAQLEDTRRRLEEQEEKIKRYKLIYGGELPQQEKVNLDKMQRMQDQIKNNTDSIARLQDRKIFLETNLNTLTRGLSGGEADPGGVDYLIPLSLLKERAERRKNLEDANRKYTPHHPAVVQAKWELEQIEKQIAEARREAKKSGLKGGDAIIVDTQALSPEMAEVHRLRYQITQVDMEINALKRENANATRMINEIQFKVERVPQREQEIIALTRDYDNLKKSYDELQDKKLQANISKNLEMNQKAERFQVLEPAGLPSKPSRPDRLKAFGIALLAFLAVGIGGALVTEKMDPRLRRAKEFKNYFEVPVLACLPVIHDDKYKKQLAFRTTLIRSGLVSVLGVYLVFLVLYGSRIKVIVEAILGSIGEKN